MNPKLVALEGPLAGQAFEIAGDRWTIGRSPTNDLCVPASRVSREHCLIEASESHFTLRDLDSAYGTYVNGLRIRQHRLEHDDRIVLAEIAFAFLLHEAALEAPAPAVEFDETAHRATSVLESPHEQDHERLAELLGTRDPSTGYGRVLTALLNAPAAMQEVRRLEEVGDRLLPLVLEAIPGEHAALILTNGTDGEPTEVFSRAAPWSTGALRISRTVLRRVLRDRVGLLARDLEGPGDLASVASLADLGLRSLVCVPLVVRGRSCGALYVDTRHAGRRLGEVHLRLATVMAGLAAAVVDQVRYLGWLENERQRLLGGDVAPEILGVTPEIERVRDFISRVAPTESTVLLVGESGTGKELAARAIYRNSRRSDRPFVVVNCAAVPENLLESELFGYERGAFSGAVARKQGRLEAADTGTAFFDEVGELSLALQAKLLRVLEQQEIEHVGGTQPIKIDLRILAATNRELDKAVAAGTFRRDLYHRLNVLRCTMPPLRVRTLDIPLLAERFLASHCRKLGRPVMQFSQEVQACLLRYDWPGNVRELSNAIERVVVLAQDDLVGLDDLPEELRELGAQASPTGTVGLYATAIARLKADLIESALDASGGNVADAARRLGLHPKHLFRLIRNLGLRPKREAS